MSNATSAALDTPKSDVQFAYTALALAGLAALCPAYVLCVAAMYSYAGAACRRALKAAYAALDPYLVRVAPAAAAPAK